MMKQIKKYGLCVLPIENQWVICKATEISFLIKNELLCHISKTVVCDDLEEGLKQWEYKYE